MPRREGFLRPVGRFSLGQRSEHPPAWPGTSRREGAGRRLPTEDAPWLSMEGLVTGCSSPPQLESYIQMSVKSEMVQMQQNVVQNQTATMLEIGTSLLSQTAEQTRKLTDVEAQVPPGPVHVVGGRMGQPHARLVWEGMAPSR